MLAMLIPAGSTISAQSVTVNTLIKPPYKPHLYDLAEQTRVILTPVSSVTMASLVVTIKGDNGVMLRTSDQYQPGDLTLRAGMTTQLTSMELDAYFNASHLVSSGIPMPEIVNNGLPEGSYQICIRVKNSDGAYVSSEEPMGCSNFFSIRYNDPPVPVNPQCGSVISNMPVQNIVFTWTPSPGAPSYTAYTLRMVELLDSTQNPNAAMLSAKEPVFFETTVHGSFSYHFGPADPVLEKGRIYAWQVIASEEETNVRFSNNGRSEVCWFKWDPKSFMPLEVSTPVKKTPGKKAPITAITNIDPVPISTVTGTLNYKFKGAASINAGQTVNMMGSSDGLVYNEDNISNENSFPLGNVKVSLVISYVLKGKINNKSYSGQAIDLADMQNQGQNKFLESYPDQDKVLATTTTATDGSFSFTFMNTMKNLGLEDEDANWQSNGGEFYDKVEGRLYKVIRLKVENKYYCSPDINIKLNPWEAIDLGTLVSYVKSYNLKVITKTTNSAFYDVAGGLDRPIDKIKTTVRREHGVDYVPANEGGSASVPSQAFPKNIKTSYSNESGEVLFTDLVQHDPDKLYDCYFIVCEPDNNQGVYVFKQRKSSYYPANLKEQKQFPYNSKGYYTPESGPVQESYGENVIWNSQLKIRTYEKVMYLTPDKPRIAGKVENQDVKAKKMSNVKILMINTYKTSSAYDKPILTATTDANGYYEFNALEPEIDEWSTEGTSQIVGPDRKLFCIVPDGFKSNWLHPGVLKYGQQLLDQNFILEPDGLLEGYVTDEDGKPIQANIQVDDLAFASTQMVFEKDKPMPVQVQPGAVQNIQPGAVSPNVSPGDKTPVTSSQQQISHDNKQVQVNQAAQVSPSSVQRQGNHVNVSAGNVTATAQPLDIGTMKQFFSIKAPSGNDRKLTIQPKDQGYSAETYTVSISKSGAAIAGAKTYVVYKMKKRIHFRVAEKPSNPVYAVKSLKGIAGVSVSLEIPGESIVQTTDDNGYVSFEFENNGTSFTFSIEPSADADYENTTYTINNVPDSKSMITYNPAFIKKATRISGTVSLGNSKTPLQGAIVYIDYGNGERIETSTSPDGSYLLKKVPVSPSTITLWASKPGQIPNVISQSKPVKLGTDNKVDFTLKQDSAIAITDIFGFKADIQKKEKQSDGTYLISGSLIDIPQNANFRLANADQTIPFSNLKVKAGDANQSGIPIGVPVNDQFTTDIPNLSLVLNNVFSVLQKPSTGSWIQISSENKQGKISGNVALLTSSFQFSGNYITFTGTDPFWLTLQAGSTDQNITTITVADYQSKIFGISGPSGGDIQFKYLNFNAKADKTKSTIENDLVRLAATTLTTNEIAGLNPSKLSIPVGDLVLHSKKIDPVNSNTPLNFKLEKWNVTSNTWNIQQGSSGVNIPTGTIKTGLVDIPVKNIVITPDNFSVGEFELDNLTFSGAVPLNVLGGYQSFGYNTSTGVDHKGHWELRITGTGGEPAVTIAGLPGMQPGSLLKFQSLSLLSNGEQNVNLGNQQQELVFYDVLKAKPIGFSGGDKYFDMQCNIDVGIPRIEPASGIIRFSKSSGTLKTEIYPFNVSFDGPGGVRFNASLYQGDQAVNTSGYSAKGVIKDKEGIILKAKLHRTIDKAWIEVDPLGQTLPLGTGGTSLAKVEGRMDVDKTINDWTKFTFSGDMTGFTGMESQVRKTFTISGSITAENEGLGVKNISVSFGGMNITYDVPNSRLLGDVQVDQQIGALHLNAAINFCVDNTGWYFMAGGLVTSPGYGTMAAGMLLGDYHQMAPNVTQTLMQFAYNKNVPAAFQTGVSGFLFIGQKTVPVINIPDFDMDLGIITVSLGLAVGLDARFWMSFSGDGNEYGIGAMAFAHAWLTAESITCTKLTAEARAELGMEGVYQSKTGIFTAKGCGSFSIGGSVKQCIPTPCLSDGICCEGCFGTGINLAIMVNMLLDSKGNTSLDFAYGNCSGQ
jgi:hypothetical protein